VAKKRKGARPAASRAAKKTTRKPAKKAARRTVMLKKPRTGLESREKVDFNPLKTHLRAHIERLSSAPAPSPAIQRALESLRQAQATLTSECLPTMVIPFP
jgi:hypothetical protein